MSYSPFDGVLLDDLRDPMPGAFAMALHYQVAESQGASLNQDAIENRAAACRELLEHGLSPAVLGGLSKHGLSLGNPKNRHSLNSVKSHLEKYLEAVSSAGYIEPSSALWEAVDAELNGKRGLWVERAPHDGPIEATLKDLKPSRLRALACLPHLGGAVFKLATRRGGSASGLFGSGQPLVDWFMGGLEAHGQAFAADLQLAEPEGWGSAPWSGALDSLFEAPLELGDHKMRFQRALVDSPWELVLHAVEQIAAWANQGIDPMDITLIHPAPEKIREPIEILLMAEGVQSSPARSLRPLMQSKAWSPIWSFLDGLNHLDPCPFATGLQNSKRPEIRAWADILSASDQSGHKAFEMGINRLPDPIRSKAKPIWQSLLKVKEKLQRPREWAETLADLITSQLRFPVDSEDFYAPMGLLKECWSVEPFCGAASKKQWDFNRMLGSLRIFLESARSNNAPMAAGGVRLLSPSEVMEGWGGSEATLVLDLSEGSWPAPPIANPDLDWACRASINSALLLASQNYSGPFPPALQRFWLPRAEHTNQMPRAFQRDAYAFNKVAAMTRRSFLALSPAQDETGRKVAQGPFWAAIEGAGCWEPDPVHCSSNLRLAWEGSHRQALADSRSKSVQALGPEALFASTAPKDDHITGIRQALQNQKPYISPTVLESLARCPFRTVAERVWRLDPDDAAGQMQKTVGTIAHRLLQTILQPVLNVPDWPEAFMAHYKLTDAGAGAMESLVREHWLKSQGSLLTDEARKNSDQFRLLLDQVEALLPNIAAYLQRDIEDTCPTQGELELFRSGQKEGWRKTIIGLEQKLGPMELPMGNGQTMAVAGVVDRIELFELRENHLGSPPFRRVTDYKATTRTRLNEYAAGDAPFGTHLQTPLYAWMATEEYGGHAAAVLVPLREQEPKPFANNLKRLAEVNASGGQWQSRLAKTLAHLDSRINGGDFPPTPGDHCQTCKHGALCMRPADIAAYDDGDADD